MATSPNAMAFLNRARQYQKAASRLLQSVLSETPEGHPVPLSDPIYFLYFHTVELAFKAVLRFHGEDAPRGPDGHDIVELHRRCQVLGLRIKAGPQELQNVVDLLASGNEDHGFRYFNPKNTKIPELSWTRDVVDSLMQAIREGVGDGEDLAQSPGPAVKVILVVDKPTEQQRQ